MKNLLTISLICLMLSPSVMAEEKSVLVIESYHAEYPWDMSYREGIESVLGGKCRIDYFQMDTKRVPASEYEKRAEMAWEKVKEVRPDLVILGDDNALRFVGPKLANTKTPVVYLGINQNPRAYKMYGVPNITGILERPLFRRSVMYVGDIVKPTPKKALVLFDSGETSIIVADDFFKGERSKDLSGVEVHIKTIGRLDEWKNTVKSAKKDGFDVVFIGLYHTIVDSAGNHADSEKILRWSSENSPVPPFAFWDFAVGPDKTIGGYVLCGKPQGEMAGKMALEILSGKKPADIMPEVPERGQLLFSRSQLKKWDLTLPEKTASKATFTD